MKKSLVLAALCAVVSATAAMAGGINYSGSWPVTISGSQSFNGQHCLQLSGVSALLDGSHFGEVQLTNHTIVAYLQTDGQNGEVATLLFASPAHHGDIGPGAFAFVQGGHALDTGKTLFGTKGGC